MTKIALTSDTHYGRGMTNKDSLRNRFKQLAEEESPDFLIHAGDWEGTEPFSVCVEQTMQALREFLPSTPVLAVTGNHDLWLMDRNHRTQERWEKEQAVGRDAGRAHGVQWLDEVPRGVTIQDFRIVGTMTWYEWMHPNTNDVHWMPKMQGQVHAHIRAKERAIWNDICDGLVENPPEDLSRLIIVTHHPIVYPHMPNTGHGGPAEWAADLEMAAGGIPGAYLNGHYHERWEGNKDTAGRKRWEAGSDYGNPSYVILEV